MISQEKLMTLIHLQKLPKNVRDLGKLIVAKGFKKLPKVQKIAKSGHTDCIPLAYRNFLQDLYSRQLSQIKFYNLWFLFTTFLDSLILSLSATVEHFTENGRACLEQVTISGKWQLHHERGRRHQFFHELAEIRLGIASDDRSLEHFIMPLVYGILREKLVHLSWWKSGPRFDRPRPIVMKSRPRFVVQGCLLTSEWSPLFYPIGTG